MRNVEWGVGNGEGGIGKVEVGMLNKDKKIERKYRHIKSQNKI